MFSLEVISILQCRRLALFLYTPTWKQIPLAKNEATTKQASHWFCLGTKTNKKWHGNILKSWDVMRFSISVFCQKFFIYWLHNKNWIVEQYFNLVSAYWWCCSAPETAIKGNYKLEALASKTLYIKVKTVTLCGLAKRGWCWLKRKLNTDRRLKITHLIRQHIRRQHLLTFAFHYKEMDAKKDDNIYNFLANHICIDLRLHLVGVLHNKSL